MKTDKILVFALSLIFSAAAFYECTSYASAPDVVISIRIDSPVMEVNGIETEIDEGRGTVPVIIDDRAMLPIRAVMDALGGETVWDCVEEKISLSLDRVLTELEIGRSIAYINGAECPLDAAPCIIHDRTMLPVRFIAEGFNLGIAWNNDTKTVTIVKSYLDEEENRELLGIIPKYAGNPYEEINENIPFFKDYELIPASFEYYSSLDDLGRCNVCMASVSEDIMPTEKRTGIGMIKPTGWHTVKYDCVSGKYLYNRCHLIGFQLTGENANERNLITGTRYLNTVGMLPFENTASYCVKNTDNHVLYRVTPVFEETNLLSLGVLIEAFSVEDMGESLSFCVFCYNVQPQIEINYADGSSRLE